MSSLLTKLIVRLKFVQCDTRIFVQCDTYVTHIFALFFFQMFENLKNPNNAESWDTCEAALFVMSAVAKNVLP